MIKIKQIKTSYKNKGLLNIKLNYSYKKYKQTYILRSTDNFKIRFTRNKY